MAPEFIQAHTLHQHKEPLTSSGSLCWCKLVADSAAAIHFSRAERP